MAKTGGLPQNRKTSVAKYASNSFKERMHSMKLNKIDEQVIAALKEKESTLAEITEKTGAPSKKVFKSLRKLFEHEMIDSQARKYRFITDKPTVKGKEADEAAEDEE